MTFSEEETEAAVGYTSDELVGTWAWAFTNVVPLMTTSPNPSTAVDDHVTGFMLLEALRVELAPVEAEHVREGESGEAVTEYLCEPDFLVTGVALFSVPELNLGAEGTVRVQRDILEAGGVDYTTFKLRLEVDPPEALPDVNGIEADEAWGDIHFPLDLDSAGSRGALIGLLPTAEDFHHTYYYVEWE